MSSRFGASLSKNAGQTHSKITRRGGLPSMSESQTRAYLAARDLLRRIHRSSSTRTRNPLDEGGNESMGERA